MALKSETASPPDGMANVINQESGGNDDLEDGEIFDDEDDTPMPTIAPPAPSLIEEKRKLSPVRKANLARQKRPKRLREDERPFRNAKQRRKSDESEKSKDKANLTEDEEMHEMSPLRGSQEWERGHHRTNFSDDFIDDEEDDDELGSRRGRCFGNRSRRGRNGRGGRRGGIARRDNSQICRFFILGKCQKGPECPYSHAQQRKYELCKFYLMDCCAKKDRCLFMHSEFPCKYYYLGMKCYAGKKCKYFHGKISSQLRANLLRDSKECDFLQHPQDSSPKEDSGRTRRDRERERNREHRDREHKDNKERDREKDRDKDRDRRDDKDRDNKYTLHFKVDPRTISDEEEGNKTPMPSPSQDNSSDRGSKSPETDGKKKDSPKADNPPSSEHKDNNTEELPNFIPGELDKHQRELYRRIQQRREAPAVKTEEEQEEKETDDYRDEDWYSSEEDEEDKNPLHTILKTLKQTPAARPSSPPKPSSAPVQVLPIFSEIDINAVSKLLSTVRETIQQKQQSDCQNNLPMSTTTTAPSVPNSTLSTLSPLPSLASLIADPLPPVEKSRRRDPRIKSNSTEDDIDLRMGPKGDVDLRQLPFKPAPVQTPASEILASLTSHPPVEYRVIRISSPPPPDYTTVPSKNVNDPRLKNTPGTSTMLPPMAAIPPPVTLNPTKPIAAVEPHRDPRQRGLLANDPRRKSSVLLQRDSDLRQAPQAFNTVNDIDLRLHPAATHLAFK